MVKILTKIFFFILMSTNSSTYPNLIAHAGGQTNGEVYSNSINAIEESLKKEFKYIEIDLHKTSDNIFFGLHKWEDLKKIQLISKDYVNELEKKYISGNLLIEDIYNFNKISPIKILTEEYILKFFKKNNQLILFTDKTNDFKKLEKLNLSLNGRVYVEISSIFDYLISLNYKFGKRLFYTDFGKLDYLFIKIMNIDNLVINKAIFNAERNLNIVNEFNKLNKNLHIFTLNSEGEISKKFKRSNIYIYTDFINPKK